MSNDFHGTETIVLSFLLPTALDPVAGVSRLNRPNGNYLDLLGRIRPGTNPQAIEAKLRVEFHDWLASHVADMEPGEKQLWKNQYVRLVPGDAGVADMREPI